MSSPAKQLLSARQAEIAAMIARAHSNAEIAAALNVSERTVESHIAAIFNKLGVRSRVELATSLVHADAGATAAGPRLAGPQLPPLPIMRTDLIGRETEVEEIRAALAEHPLLTIAGAGGVGKTRVALAVAAAEAGSAAGGAALVELAPLADDALVPGAIAQALNVPEQPPRPPLATLVAHIGEKPLLLVLDNCEHVIAGAAQTADALLRACPNVRIVATSREPLRIAGERTYRLPSLRVPSAAETPRLDAAAAGAFAAVELFVARARAADRRFALGNENAPFVAEICRRLDGIPLAIELAAARVTILPPWALAARLDEHLRILSAGHRTALPRHQTMLALIDWSYDLLPEAERRLFVRLSAFAGGCALSEAAAVFADDEPDETETFALLSSLVDKSLAVTEPGAREPRYRLLESARQYGRDKLLGRGELQHVARLHARACVALAERTERAYDRASDAEWIAVSEPERENFRTALEWTLGAKNDVALGQRLVAAMRAVLTSLFPDGRRWLHAALEHVDERTPAVVAADLELTLANFNIFFSEFAEVYAASERLISVFETLGDPVRTARAQLVAAIALLNLHRPAEAQPLLDRAMVTARSSDNPRFLGITLEALAAVRFGDGDIAAARALRAEALDLYNAMGAQRFASLAAINLADAEFLLGNYARAADLAGNAISTMRHLWQPLYVLIATLQLTAHLIACERWDEARALAFEAFDLAAELEGSVHLAWALQHLAVIAALSAPDRSAATLARCTCAAGLLGYVDACIARRNASRGSTEEHGYARARAALSAAFGTAAFERLAEAGASLTAQEAKAAALSL